MASAFLNGSLQRTGQRQTRYRERRPTMRWIRQMPSRILERGSHRLTVLVSFLSLSLLASPTASGAAEEKSASATPIFEKAILPLLQAKCLRCHGTDQLKADLDLRSKATL